MKSIKTYLLAVILLLCAIPAFSEDISLNGEWQLSVNDKDYTVQVPHTYNIMPGLEDYAGEAVYKKVLPVTQAMKGKTVRVHFNGVYHDAVVYVNGRKAGEHLGKGYTPFSIDITRLLNLKGTDTMTVKVSNAYSDKQLPYKRSFDWSNDGGIYRSVRLHVSGQQALRYVHVTPSNDGIVRFGIRLFNDKDSKLKGSLKITNRQTGETVYQSPVSLSKKKGDKEFYHTVKIDSPQLWHFDHPNLYDFTFTIPGNDSLTDHFGFRELKVSGNCLSLNGESVRLPGIEDMPGSNPVYGMAEPKQFMEASVRIMKDLNCTITRFHWIQDEERLSLMDEMGILAQEELSWWQQPWKKLTPELRQSAKETIEEMIEAHYNHPCIYAWGVSNEVRDNEAEIRLLGDYARQLDSTRIIDLMSNITFRTLDKDPSLALDLPTWNEYTGTWHGKNREELPQRLANIKKILNGRPLFITEHGLCEPAFTGGDERRINDMIYHIKEWQKTGFVCGYIYFCLQDYRTQMGEEGYGKYRVRRHGVTRTDLTPKASYYVLRQLMCPIEITTVMPANSKKSGDALAGQIIVNPTDHDALIVLRNKNSIPSYTLQGYTLQYKDADGNTQTMDIPVLEPGKETTLVLRNINARYNFGVLRPNGFKAIEY